MPLARAAARVRVSSSAARTKALSSPRVAARRSYAPDVRPDAPRPEQGWPPPPPTHPHRAGPRADGIDPPAADIPPPPPDREGRSQRDRTILLGLVGVTIPTLVYLGMRNSTKQTKAVPDYKLPSDKDKHDSHLPPPREDPATRKRERGYTGGQKDGGPPGVPRYLHPEHKEPEKFKPPPGVAHPAKRNDGPPDGRNHENLSNRARQW
ncbi:hypothetical protein GGR56DRAFT_686505 [Xylariaceae sp. FL0804]|nr:hypothetical protein GGR56DRAFT_686505 [Xylariaceae sp. FL0804]